MFVFPFRWTSTVWRHGQMGISWSSSRGNVKSCIRGRINTSCTGTGWWPNAWKAVLQNRTWRSQCTMDWQWGSYVLLQQEDNSVTSHTWKAIFGRLWEVILPLCLRLVRPHLECSVQSCTVRYDRHGHTGMRPVKDHSYNAWRIRHRMGLFSLEKIGGDYVCLNIWWRHRSGKKVRVMEPNSSWW